MVIHASVALCFRDYAGAYLRNVISFCWVFRSCENYNKLNIQIEKEKRVKYGSCISMSVELELEVAVGGWECQYRCEGDSCGASCGCVRGAAVLGACCLKCSSCFCRACLLAWPCIWFPVACREVVSPYPDPSFVSMLSLFR